MGTDQNDQTGMMRQDTQGIHVVAKPSGPVCNLNCEYCFYLEKQALFGSGKQCRMSDEVLTAFITNYITSQPTPVVEFVWQGGEPTLMGFDFFRRIVELQQPFAGNKTITNALQTNGTKLNDEPGLNYLCKGHKYFFLHIRKYLRAMAQLLENDLLPSLVMKAVKGPLVIKRNEGVQNFRE